VPKEFCSTDEACDELTDAATADGVSVACDDVVDEVPVDDCEDCIALLRVV
jgi:hypothetical protein